jgi:hypothetical protein
MNGSWKPEPVLFGDDMSFSREALMQYNEPLQGALCAPKRICKLLIHGAHSAPGIAVC